MTERIQKVLANAGVASRRTIEDWISAGRIYVNGSQATLGQKIGPKDRVEVDGRKIRLADATPQVQVIAYHKPVGQVCSRYDEDGRPTVFEALPKISGGRWVSVGRLDVNTAGLLLFTNDGELANRLMHPSSEVQREYAVRALGSPSESDLAKLTKGVELDDGPARCHGLRVMEKTEGANQWYRVVLIEGRKREVRRLFEAIGLKVNRLIRVRFGDIELHRTHRIEEVRVLSPGEHRSLYRVAGLTLPDELVDKTPVQQKSARKKPVRRNKGRKR